MPEGHVRYAYGLIPAECMESMFVDGSILHPRSLGALLDVPCLKIIASKAVGYTLFAASAAVKVPQILRFIASGSVSGISSAYVHLELTSTICSCCYNILMGYPISTWGEMLNICLQNIVILFLYHWFSRGFDSTALFSAGFHIGTAFVLLNDMLPDLQLPVVACEPLLTYLPSACEVLPGQQLMAVLPTLIVLASRIPQIALNFAQGHTGQLSMVTSTLFLLGNVARLFTNLTEVKDPVLLAGVIVSLLLNGTLVLQLFIFRRKTQAYMRDLQAGKTK